MAAGRYADHSQLSSGRWVKIRVSKEGVYQLTPSYLAGIGFSNPANVRIFGYNLPVLPEAKIETISDDVTEIPAYRRGDGTLLFYSFGTVNWTRSNASSKTFTHTQNPYSKYIYYFLTEGTPAPFKTETLSQPPLKAATTFPEHTLIESDDFSYTNVGRAFLEGYDFEGRNSKTYNLPTPGIADGYVQMALQFVGGGRSTLAVNVNGTNMTAISMADLSKYQHGKLGSKSYTINNNYGGSMQVTLKQTSSTSGMTGHLDYIRGSYSRNLSMSGVSYLPFRTNDDYNYKIRIDAASGDTRVWKVTSPALTCEQPGSLTGSNYIADIANNGMDEFVAVNVNAQFPTPETVGDIANQDLHSIKDIEYVIIVPENGIYTSIAQQLADAHTQREGMSCCVVRADQIYNEFSSGTPDATAYRRFMKMLWDKAQDDKTLRAPKNLLLFGAGVWDNRMITPLMAKRAPKDYLLCYESNESYSLTDSYVCEEYFGLLADGKGVNPLRERADIGIGRLPFTDVTTAKNTVDKLIRYINNENSGAWKNTICLMGDDGDNNRHMQDAEEVLKVIQPKHGNYYYKKIYWDSYPLIKSSTGNTYPGVLDAVNKTMQDGALIMNYTGHGSESMLSHEQVLKSEHFRKWSSPKLPLWITAACDIVPFDRDKESLAIDAVFNKRGAAMGFIGTARTVYSSQNLDINKRMMNYLLTTNSEGRRYTIGQALSMAKGEIAQTKTISRDLINKSNYLLIGDPAITLGQLSHNISIDQINGAGITPENPQRLKAGDKATISGHIEDKDGNLANTFNGIISSTVFDSEETIVCNRNNSTETDTALVYRDRTRTLFKGEFSIQNGRFSFTFPVPLDINYSNLAGMLNLFATDGTHEASTNFRDFILGGTGSYHQDGNGPDITAYLNREDFSDGDEVNETPFVFIHLFDEDGINTTGNGLGHDIEIIIDNDEQKTYSLNNYYKSATGNYTEGTIGFSIPELEEGHHTMLIRAFDTRNNVGTKTLEFNVVKGLKPDIAYIHIGGPVRDKATIRVYSDRKGSIINVNMWVYDLNGHMLYKQTVSGEENLDDYYEMEWNIPSTRGIVPPGIYAIRIGLSTSDGEEALLGKKIMVLGDKQP